MISFMADVIGIRDDMYIGKGHTYQKEVVQSVTEGYKDGILEQKPTLVNLQCDIDHPTQCMADAAHIINTFGGLENLKGKKIAMTWAYSPSYGKPLSVPQGVIGLMTRLGMEVVLAHPEGYEVMPEVEEVAKKMRRHRAAPSASRTIWQMHLKMLTSYIRRAGLLCSDGKRTQLYADGDQAGIDALEKNSLHRTLTTKIGAAQKI